VSRVALASLLVACASGVYADSEHVPPEPPQTHVHEMRYDEMVEMMGMDDRALFGKVMLDRLEWRDAHGSTYGWEAAAWYGGDFNKVWLATEGEHVDGSVADARVELLWDRILTAWWSTRLGAREDFGDGPAREWLTFGVAGLAPGFFEVEAMAFVGESGRTALRFSADYDLLVTQRLVLQPETEVNIYGSDDPERLIGSGLSNLEIGLRLRYELRREFAPYIGVSWSKRFGNSADLAEAAGEDSDELSFVMGLRVWF
jgi:copper resistance protein B